MERTAAGREATTVAELSHVSLFYGDEAALDGVSLVLRAGEWVALTGGNGSGKSTLGRVLAGLMAPDAGTVTLLGHRVFSDPADDAAGGNASGAGGMDADAYLAARRDGIGLVIQNPEDQIVTTVVADDVAFGPENLGVEPDGADGITSRVEGALDAVGMRAHEGDDPDGLSGGQQQRVAIAGALAMHPRLLVLDEPTAMLDAAGRREVMDAIARAHAAGTAVIHITHSQDEMERAGRVIRLDRGRVAYDGPVDGAPSLRGSSTFDGLGCVADDGMEFGHSAGTAGAMEPGTIRRAGGNAAVVFDAHDVSYRYSDAGPWAVRHQSLGVQEGEFVALTGDNGAGKSTLLALLCGLVAPTSGSVRALGLDTRSKRNRRALAGRVGYVMQHPERQLFAQTVADDVAFGPRNMGLKGDALRRRVMETLESLHISDLADRSPWELSGGQQRLVALAGVIAMRPAALLLDEPTAGLDAEAAIRVAKALRHIHRSGVTMVMVSHDPALVAALATRVVRVSAPDPAETADARGTRAARRPAPLARMDPRFLLVTSVALMVAMFFVSTLPQLLWAFLAVGAGIALCPAGLRRVARESSAIVGFILILGLLNLFFVRTGEPVAHIGSFAITSGGVNGAVVGSLRLALVIVLGVVCAGSCTPMRLTDAAESLFSPLAKLGAHVHDVALILSLALRFLPVMSRELRELMQAQATRGGDVGRGSPGRRFRAMCALIVPMFAGALRHADHLGTALDARCYTGGAGRTKWHRPHPGAADAAVCALVLLWLAGLAVLRALGV